MERVSNAYQNLQVVLSVTLSQKSAVGAFPILWVASHTANLQIRDMRKEPSHYVRELVPTFTLHRVLDRLC